MTAPGGEPAFAIQAPQDAAPPRLGRILCDRGLIGRAELARALWLQRQSGVRLGQVLAANDLVPEAAIIDALAGQHLLPTADLAAEPCDPTLLAGRDPALCLKHSFLPWKRQAGVTWIAIVDPAEMDAVRIATADLPQPVAFALVKESALHAAVRATFGAALAERARLSCPDAYSCRGWEDRGHGRLFARLLTVAALLTLIFPEAAVVTVLVALLLSNSATAGLRLLALLAGRGAAPAPPAPLPGRLPVISLLVPLLSEASVLDRLLRALTALDYPRELLDVKIVVEADDVLTRAALMARTLPPWIEVIEVPVGRPRTKPRALNYALSFCRGEIIGIYDAEDRPEPQQLRAVAARFAAAPARVACLQGALDFYNSSQNWLTRCFTLEYSIWFRVLLPGVARMGLPIPLGGTTVFLRRGPLEEVGGWDAHNVTEDADLGMRLCRFGYRTEILASTTYEEANSVFRGWIRQRSRWLKGFCMTWATHMRRPMALCRDLGVPGFLSFQVLFLGAMAAYVAVPLFWALLLVLSLGGAAEWWQAMPDWLRQALTVSLPMGQGVMLVAAFRATRGRRGLLPWVLTLPAYWPLGAVAAYRAIAEMIVAPFYWSKTVHGLCHEPGREEEPAAVPSIGEDEKSPILASISPIPAPFHRATDLTWEMQHDEPDPAEPVGHRRSRRGPDRIVAAAAGRGSHARRRAAGLSTHHAR